MTSVIHSFWQWLGSSTMSSLCVNEGNIKLIILKLSVKNINLSYFYTILINHHPHHYHPRHHRIGINMNDKINYANEKELTTWWQSLSSFESPPCWTLSPFIEHNLRIHIHIPDSVFVIGCCRGDELHSVIFQKIRTTNHPSSSAFLTAVLSRHILLSPYISDECTVHIHI